MDELSDLATVLRLNAREGRVWARTGHRKPCGYPYTAHRVFGRLAASWGVRTVLTLVTLFALHVIVWYHAPGNAGILIRGVGGFEYRGVPGFFGPNAD